MSDTRRLDGHEWISAAFVHIAFLLIFIGVIALVHLFRWFLGLGGWIFTEAGFYGLLRGCLLLLMIAYGVFISFASPLMPRFSADEKYVANYKRLGALSGVEFTKEELQQMLDTRQLRGNFAVATSVLPMIVGFALVAYYWQHASTETPIFVRVPHGLLEVFLFSADLALRGLIFDVMEHFEIHFSDIRMNFSNYWFVGVSFVFRLYCAVLVLKALIGYVVFRKASAARQTR